MRENVTVTTTAIDTDPGLAPEIEDLTEEHGTTGRPSPWTLVVLALTSAIIGFGFLDHQLAGTDQRLGAPVPTAAAVAAIPSSTRPIDTLAISRLSNGDVIDGSTIEIRADASVPFGRIHIAALAGVVELGSSDVDVTRAGPFAASLRIIEPSWPTPIQLRITQVSGSTPGALLETRSLVSGSQETIGLLGVSAATTGRHEVVSVDGWAPAGLTALRATLDDRDGVELAAADATIGASEAWGGAMLASRPFRVRLEWAVAQPGTALRLVLTWRDAATGDLESVTQSLTVPQPAHATVP